MKQNFIKCGTCGWCLEILYTGLQSMKKKNRTLTGKTSIWMFPIYGMVCLFRPVCHRMKGQNIFLRGLLYTGMIFAGEFITGSLLKKYDACPWDYSDAPLNFRGVIRLDYAPLWFGTGLLFEKILCRS